MAIQQLAPGKTGMQFIAEQLGGGFGQGFGASMNRRAQQRAKELEERRIGDVINRATGGKNPQITEVLSVLGTNPNYRHLISSIAPFLDYGQPQQQQLDAQPVDAGRVDEGRQGQLDQLLQQLQTSQQPTQEQQLLQQLTQQGHNAQGQQQQFDYGAPTTGMPGAMSLNDMINQQVGQMAAPQQQQMAQEQQLQQEGIMDQIRNLLAPQEQLAQQPGISGQPAMEDFQRDALAHMGETPQMRQAERQFVQKQALKREQIAIQDQERIDRRNDNLSRHVEKVGEPAQQIISLSKKALDMVRKAPKVAGAKGYFSGNYLLGTKEGENLSRVLNDILSVKIGTETGQRTKIAVESLIKAKPNIKEIASVLEEHLNDLINDETTNRRADRFKVSENIKVSDNPSPRNLDSELTKGAARLAKERTRLAKERQGVPVFNGMKASENKGRNIVNDKTGEVAFRSDGKNWKRVGI